MFTTRTTKKVRGFNNRLRHLRFESLDRRLMLSAVSPMEGRPSFQINNANPVLPFNLSYSSAPIANITSSYIDGNNWSIGGSSTTIPAGATFILGQSTTGQSVSVALAGAANTSSGIYTASVTIDDSWNKTWDDAFVVTQTVFIPQAGGQIIINSNVTLAGYTGFNSYPVVINAGSTMSLASERITTDSNGAMLDYYAGTLFTSAQ